MDAVLANMIKVGIVSSVDPNGPTVRVTYPDKDHHVSSDLQLVVSDSLNNKRYFNYDVGEQVLTLSLPNSTGATQGFVLGALYSTEDQALAGMTKDKYRMDYLDGAFWEYDRDAHQLTANIPSKVSINVGEIVSAIVGQSIIVNVPKIIVTGDVIAGGISLIHHTHGGVEPGGGSTAPPNGGG